MGLILGFLTYIGWGAGDIFGIYATRKVGTYVATSFVLIFGFLVASLYVPFAINDMYKITPVLFILNVLLGVGILFGNFMLNEAFKRSNVSMVGIIVQSFPVVVLLLSALIFKDPITSKQIIWTMVIFIGIAICTVNFRDFKKSHIFTDYGVKLVLVASTFFVMYFTFLRLFIDVYGWFWPNYISIASFPLAILVAKRFFKVKEKIKMPKDKKVLAATFISAFLLRGGDIALNYGISLGLSATVTPIASAGPTLFITLSRIVFKDPISGQQKAGIAVCLVGIILLGFFAT